MSKNSIPKPINRLIALGSQALEGALEHGDDVELKQHTATAIATDFHAFAGRSEEPPILGKQLEYGIARAAHSAARSTYRAARDGARAFCAEAVDKLKGIHGRSWNASWHAVGFTNGSIAIPADPTALLMALDAHFRANPSYEDVAHDVTASVAQTHSIALANARAAVNTARIAEEAAKQARDTAKRKLRNRLSGLLAELNSLLSPEDPRWYAFGFLRPADGNIPSIVTGVTLTEGAPGSVVVRWDSSVRAENYRVQWRIEGEPGDPNVVGLFTDREAVLSGLPSTETVVVGVSARNDSGETPVTEATIIVP